MERENNNNSFIIWLEEIWEEIEIQIYGLTGAIFFFIIIYFLFHPPWMKPLYDFFENFKLSFFN